jgi:GTP-binding protein
LGQRFLRHAERARFLVHVASVEDVDENQPWACFDCVDTELALFDEELARRPQIRVLNKIDRLPPEALCALHERARSEGRPLLFVSALEGRGLEVLAEAMWRLRDSVAFHGALVRPCADGAADDGEDGGGSGEEAAVVRLGE